MDIAAKNASLGLELPKPAAPVAAYGPVVEQGGMLYVSGQLPFRDGQVVTGRLGDDMDVAGGQDAAQRVALMLVAQIGQALGGDWSRVERVVKLGVLDRKSTRELQSLMRISYAVFCLKQKINTQTKF